MLFGVSSRAQKRLYWVLQDETTAGLGFFAGFKQKETLNYFESVTKISGRVLCSLSTLRQALVIY